jgi:IPT/TIG domain
MLQLTYLKLCTRVLLVDCCLLLAMVCPPLQSADGAGWRAEFERGSRFGADAWLRPASPAGQRSKLEVAQSGAPAIAALSPNSGPMGTVVTIRGANLTSKDNLVQFRGPVSFAAGSPVGSENGTILQFEVNACPSHEPRCPPFYIPPGVYAVTVINANGTSNEASFDLTSR